MILTIDVKNREESESIILYGNNNTTINLNIKGCIDSALKYLNDKEFKKARETIDSISNVYEHVYNNNSVVYENQSFLKIYKVMDLISRSYEELSKDKSIENYYNLNICLNELIEFKVFNETKVFEPIYTEAEENLYKVVENYNLYRVLENMESNIHELMIYQSKEIYILFKLINELNVNNELLDRIYYTVNETRNRALGDYNNKLEVNRNMKILLGYKYRDLLCCNDCNEYLKFLKPEYNIYKDMLKDLEDIYELYALNNSIDFEEYYNNLLSLSVDTLINLTSYLREYVSRKLYDANRKYYDINDLNLDIENTIESLDIKNNSKTIPLV